VKARGIVLHVHLKVIVMFSEVFTFA